MKPSAKIPLMPSLFVGHGSPLNITDKNEFTVTMKKIGEKLRPKAILVISAHWLEDKPTFQNSANQKTIYDFRGFPEDLYQIAYPATGWKKQLIEEVVRLNIKGATFVDSRGLDHGTWAVLHHMFPKANIPVMQLSIDKNLSFEKYFEYGQKLNELRKLGVLILGSGNITHNLREIDWDMKAPPIEWALEFDKIIEDFLDTRRFEKLLTIASDEKSLFEMAHPTTEHYIPLLYTLGAINASDRVSYPCSFIQNGSISMRSVLFGQ